MAELERFLEAQNPVLEVVLQELRAGRKETHWMWYIFPQLAALGRSERAVYYGLADLAEAEAYLAHGVLGPRLIACTEAVLTRADLTAHQIFGSPDDLKFRSCLTLFQNTKRAPEVFGRALAMFYPGPDPATLSLLWRADG